MLSSSQRNSPLYKLADSALRIQKRSMQSLVKVTSDYILERVFEVLGDIRADNSQVKVKTVLYDCLTALACDYPDAQDKHRERCGALISELVRVCLQATMDLDMIEAKAHLLVLQNEEFPDIITEVRLCMYEILEADEDSTELIAWIKEYWKTMQQDDNLGFDVDKVVDSAPVALFDCFCGKNLEYKKESAKAIMNELIEERSKYTDDQLRSKKNEILVSVLKNNYNTSIRSLPSKETFSLLLAPCVGISCSKSNVNAYSNFKKKVKTNFSLLR